MVDASSISALESAAANLDRLLRGWTEARVAEIESNPPALSKREALDTINAGIQSLWRLVSIHKSIEQLKNPPTAIPASALASKPGTPISRSADSPQDPQAPHPAQTVPPAAPRVPYVPSVPVVPSLGSLEEIIAKTDQVYAEVTALCEASGIPVPDPVPVPAADPHAAADQLGLNFLDALSRRAKFPGSGRLIDTLRADLATSPP